MKIPFLILFFILSRFLAAQQYDKLEFEHFSTNHGLSDRYINKIIQDHKGFIWVATENGLNRYDGYSFTVYRNIPDDSTSLSNNNIKTIFEDSKNRLWVCTQLGVCLYNRNKDCFQSFTKIPGDSTSLGNNLTCAILEDHANNIWVGHYDGVDKLNIVETKNKTSITFKHYSFSKHPYFNWIVSLCEDRKGYLWCGSFTHGIYRLNPISGEIKNYFIVPFDPNDLLKNYFRCAKLDKDSNLWVGLWNGNGIAMYDEKKDTFIQHVMEGPNMTSLNSIYDFRIDSDKRIWVATDLGLQIYNLSTKNVNSYTYSAFNEKGISFSNITCIFKDKQGGLWLGTRGNGINYSSMNKIRYKLLSSKNNSVITSDLVMSIASTSLNEVFFGTMKEGIYKYLPYSDSIKKYSFNDYARRFCGRNTDVFMEGYHFDRNRDRFELLPYFHSQNAYVAGVFNNGDLLLRSSTSKEIIRYSAKTGGLKVLMPTEVAQKTLDRATDWLYLDNKDTIWVVHHCSISRIIHDSVISDTYKLWPSLADSDSHIFNNICEDSKGNLWMTVNEKLVSFNRTSSKFSLHDSGFFENKIYTVVIDKKDRAWMSINNGLAMYDPSLNKYSYFTSHDGLPECNFVNASCRDTSGNLYFASYDGVLVIDPEQIHKNEFVPPIVLTNFRLLNASAKTMKAGQDEKEGTFFLSSHISELKEIVLNYNQNIITIEYAALNFTNASQNQYAYYLEGLENDWNYVGTKREAGYSGLQPGTYVFHVKGSNNNDVWNEQGVSLKIVILPPFWQTWWFRLLILLGLTMIIIIIFRIRINAVRLQKEELERQVKQRTSEIAQMNEELKSQADALREVNNVLVEQKEEITVQKEEIQEQANSLVKLNATKDKFFSIIGHDLKNPMYAINGIAKMLKENGVGMEESQLKEIYQMLDQSSSGVTSLLENLLTWARTQSNKVEFTPVMFDLHEVVESTLSILQMNAKNKHIELCSEVPVNTMIRADRNMITTVIRNLVNNAIKFTDTGLIKVQSESSDHQIKVSVIDTGVGMTDEVLKKLFRIDNHHSEKGTSGESGTGLGLIICKEFVEKHHGSIYANSQPDKGSSFSFTLPMMSLT